MDRLRGQTHRPSADLWLQHCNAILLYESQALVWWSFLPKLKPQNPRSLYWVAILSPGEAFKDSNKTTLIARPWKR